MQIYGNKRNFLHKKRVQLPKDLFGTPIWPPWRHVNTLYKMTMTQLYCHGCADLMLLFEASLHFVFKESRCCQFKTVSRHLLISFVLSSFLLVPNPKYSKIFLFFSVSFQSASYLFLLWRTDWDKQAKLVSESLIFVENYQGVVHLFSPVRGFLPHVASVCFVLHARRSLAFARLQNPKNAYRLIASLVSLKRTTTERGHMVSFK